MSTETVAVETLSPDEMKNLGVGMSNLFHEVKDGIEAALRARPGEVCCEYTAWDFFGWVWFFGGRFYCRVHVYREIQEVMNDETLEGLMQLVSDKYGWR